MTDKIRFFHVLLLLSCFVFFKSLADSKDLKKTRVTIDFLQDEISYEELLAKIPCPFIAHSVEYHSDVYVDPHEFTHLVALQSGALVLPETLTRACSLLIKKNKFSSIDIIVREDEQGKNIFFLNVVACGLFVH